MHRGQWRDFTGALIFGAAVLFVCRGPLSLSSDEPVPPTPVATQTVLSMATETAPPVEATDSPTASPTAPPVAFGTIEVLPADEPILGPVQRG